MSLTKFTDSASVIAELPDTPTLTSAQLKAKFDEVGTKIKSYLNNTLTTEVEELVETEKETLQGIILDLDGDLTRTMNNAISKENEMISDSYSTMKVYKVGDLCIYNNSLYKCKTAILVGEAWNSNHWEKTTITKNIQKQLITGQEVATNEYIDGKQVYVKRYNVGNLPNTGNKRVAHGLTNVTFRRIEGEAHEPNTGVNYYLPFPYVSFTENNDSVSIWVWQQYIEITTWTNKSTFTAFVNLYYTKN